MAKVKEDLQAKEAIKEAQQKKRGALYPELSTFNLIIILQIRSRKLKLGPPLKHRLKPTRKLVLRKLPERRHSVTEGP